MTTRSEALARATRRMAAAGVPDAARDARVLGRWAAGMTAAGFSARLAEAPDPDEAARFEAAIAARCARVPVAQIIGTREFWGRSFRVTADTLDPRPETETLVAAALAEPAARVLDLGTGTGCILLTLLAEWPLATGIGVDVSPAAVAVAAGNAAALGLSARADLRQGDWCAGLSGPFDLVVSNPPYLAEAEMAGLAPELAQEPRGALTPGGDGLDAYRAIADQVPALLAPGGRLIVEIGPTQAPPSRRSSRRRGWRWGPCCAIWMAATAPFRRVRQDFPHEPRFTGCAEAGLRYIQNHPAGRGTECTACRGDGSDTASDASGRDRLALVDPSVPTGPML